MNCRNFTKNVLVLVGKELPESLAREQLLEHAAACQSCAALAAAEKRLFEAFQTVIKGETPDQAVLSKIEDNLLNAFEAQLPHRNEQAKPKNARLFPFSLRIGWALAAFAVVIVLGLLTALNPGKENFVQGESIENLQASSESSADLPFFRFDRFDRKEPAPISRKTKSPQSGTLDRARPELVSKTKPGFRKSKENSARHEKRFFLVTDDDRLASLESGQLVRAEVETSWLFKLGIPFKSEKGNQSVEADLLIGQDGIVRAVRPLK